MALPFEHPNEDCREILAEIYGMSPEAKAAAIIDPDTDDYLRVGYMVQAFCLIDFTLRGLIEVAQAANLLSRRHLKRYPDIADGALTEAVIAALKRQDGGASEDAIKKLKQIAEYRRFRNLVAHFGMRRHYRKNYFISISKNDRDARVQLGEPIEKYGSAVAIVSRADFNNMCSEVAELMQWLDLMNKEFVRRYMSEEYKPLKRRPFRWFWRWWRRRS
jgi:hypothetical protein